MAGFRVAASGALIIGLLAGGVLAAQGPRGGGPGRGGFGMSGDLGGPALPLGRLDLSDAQRQQIRQIRERSADELRQAQIRLRQALEAQRKAIETVPTNESAIRADAQVVGEAIAEVAVQRARVYSDIWAVLTAEQQAAATKLRAEREARMAERQQRMAERREQRRGR